MRISFFIILALLAAFISSSQSINESRFKYYSVNDGLSDNVITSIKQDAAGFIWIATAHGLNRFDGQNFKQFLKTSSYNSIPDNAIYSMQLLGDELAIATNDGAQVISLNSLAQKNLNVPTSDALRYWSNACLYVQKDSSGNYGVSTKTGFYIFSANGKLKKRFDFFTEKDIGTQWMLFGNKLFIFPDGNMVQRNSAGTMVYDRTRNQFDSLAKKYSKVASLISNVIASADHMYFISSNEILTINRSNSSFDIIDVSRGTLRSFPTCIPFVEEIGWQTNVSHLDGNTFALNGQTSGFYLLQIDTLAQTVSCEPKKYFPGRFCSAVFQDREKRLWVGTNTGLFMEMKHPKMISSFALDMRPERTVPWITSLCVTTDKIFVGNNLKEIYAISKSTKQILRKINLPLIAGRSNYITCFLPVEKDTILIATTGGLFWMDATNYSFGKFLQSDFEYEMVRFLYLDKNRNVWIPMDRTNFVVRFNWINKDLSWISDSSNDLFRINFVNTIAEDHNGKLWFSGDGIVRWNPELRKIDTLIHWLPTQRNRKKGFWVMTDFNGDIWTMVNDDGFAKITSKFVYLRPENIMSQNFGFLAPTLIFDKIFIPTRHGIGFVDIHSFKGVMLNAADGLPEQPITATFYEDPSDHSSWFATGNDICRISPLNTTNFLKPPELKLTELEVIDDTIIWYPQNKIRLNHNQNDLKLSISAINFTDPENMRFAYRITDRDSSWIEAGNQPNILLTNIAPGDYTLQIKVYAYDNKWPEQIESIGIMIKPPFTKTPLFYSIVAVLLGLAMYMIYWIRIRQIKQKSNLDKLLSETEMKSLHAQMNPHFIFNCLNSIREMILNNENKQASHYLNKFAQLIRITLNQSSKPFVSLENTIDYLQRYLEMEKIRASNFTHTIEVDESLVLNEIMLPPMLIQPFIENAIWHGVNSLDQSLKIDIRFQKDDQQLLCVIEDDGIGIERSLKQKEAQLGHQSVGIENIKQRIRVLNEKYNLQSTISIEDKSDLIPQNGTGTIVKLRLPIKNAIV